MDGDGDSGRTGSARLRMATRHKASAFEGSIDPPRNFTITTEERVRAMSIGTPAYAERKRRIEDAEDGWIRQLLDVHDALQASGAARETILAAMRQKAARFDFARVNALVEKHNRYYPIEANLPMDFVTGGYLVAGRPWRPEAPFDAERVLATALAVAADRASAREM